MCNVIYRNIIVPQLDIIIHVYKTSPGAPNIIPWIIIIKVVIIMPCIKVVMTQYLMVL